MKNKEDEFCSEIKIGEHSPGEVMVDITIRPTTSCDSLQFTQDNKILEHLTSDEQ